MIWSTGRHAECGSHLNLWVACVCVYESACVYMDADEEEGGREGLWQ